MRKGRFLNFPQLREILPHADQVGKFTVFNIAGNKVRLIAAVHPTPLSYAETARLRLMQTAKAMRTLVELLRNEAEETAGQQRQ